MQKGSLNRHVEAPFLGKSVTHETFVDHKDKSRKELIRPIDEVYNINIESQILYIVICTTVITMERIIRE